MTNTDTTYRVTADELRQFVEQLEKLDAEKKDLTEHRADILKEAVARGYNKKVIANLIALRKREADEIAEEEAVMEMYKEALGM